MTLFAARVLRDAAANVGVHEDGSSNAGPSIDVYLKFVGLPPGNPWCAAFLCFRMKAAAEEMGLTIEPLDLPRTGSTSALHAWLKLRGLLLPAPAPGCIGMVRGGPTGHSHTFLVEKVRPPVVLSVDANEADRVMRSAHRIRDCDFGKMPL